MAGRSRVVEVPSYRDEAACVDVALVTATNVMRAKLEEATGDQLAVDVALRIMAPAIASFQAALAAQRV